MCPLCLTSLAVTVATTTGVGATAAAIATRVVKSLARRPSSPDTAVPAPSEQAQGAGGGQ
jgi:hypothetical protein